MDAWVIGFGGVILGAVLTWVIDWYGRKKEKKEVTEGVRALLSLEIDTNLKGVVDFWNVVNKIDIEEKESDFAKKQIVRQMVRIPFADMSRLAFQSQMVRLPEALDKSLLSRVIKFYTRLAQLQVLRDTLEITEQERAANNRAIQSHSEPLPPWSNPSTSMDNVPGIYDEFVNFVEQLIKDGNPLSV